MRFERVLIYLPYGVIITAYFVSYYTAQNSVQQAVRVAALMHVRNGARDDLVSSHNCDRHFHFFKATSHTIAFCTRESAMFFFLFWIARKSALDMPEARLKSHLNRCHISAGTHKFKSAVLVSGVPFQKSTLKKLEHILSCKSSRPCPKLLARVPKFWSAVPKMNVV